MSKNHGAVSENISEQVSEQLSDQVEKQITENGDSGSETHGARKDTRVVRRSIACAIMAAWVIYIILIVINKSFISDIVSIGIVFAATCLIAMSVNRLGRYRYVGISFLVGTISYLAADICWLIDIYFTDENDILYIVADQVYMFMDVAAAVGIGFFVLAEYCKSYRQRFFVNAFEFSVIFFLLSLHLLHSDQFLSLGMTGTTITGIAYYFVVSVIFIMVVLIMCMGGLRHVTFWESVMVVSLIFYNLMETRYTWFLFKGEDGENSLIDIIYLLCIASYSFVFAFGLFEDRPQLGMKELKSVKKSEIAMWGNAVVMLVITLALYVVNFYNASEVYYSLTTVLAYIIMFKSIVTNELNEQLMKNQQEENERLERMVEEKTRELTEINKHLVEISTTDPLTKLYNRRYGMDLLDKLTAEKSEFALYSIDLNYFKPINDNYGHDMGDLVLKEVGVRLKAMHEHNCTAWRNGGDEFMLLLHDTTDEKTVADTAEIFCKSMDETMHFTVKREGEEEEKSYDFTISASLGVSRFPTDTSDLNELIKLADEALYEIKHTSEKSCYLIYHEK